MSNDFPGDGPSLVDLVAIVAEWPQIEADIEALADPDEVDRLVAEIEAIETGMPAPRRRRRRVERRLIKDTLTLIQGHTCNPWNLVEVALTSDCRFGCKILRCPDCGGEQVSHRAVYGCSAGLNPAIVGRVA
jgi:hypothetical protein